MARTAEGHGESSWTEQLVVLRLRLAELREDGLPFDQAWTFAAGCAGIPVTTRLDEGLVRFTKRAFRAAYDGTMGPTIDLELVADRHEAGEPQRALVCS